MANAGAAGAPIEAVVAAWHQVRTSIRAAHNQDSACTLSRGCRIPGHAGGVATGFLVGLLEWACIKAINPHLDWPREQTVGTYINVSHSAATPPGMEVTASVELLAVEGKKLVFSVRAHDGVDLISVGQHERYVILKERFDAKVLSKKSGA